MNIPAEFWSWLITGSIIGVILLFLGDAARKKFGPDDSEKSKLLEGQVKGRLAKKFPGLVEDEKFSVANRFANRSDKTTLLLLGFAGFLLFCRFSPIGNRCFSILFFLASIVFLIYVGRNLVFGIVSTAWPSTRGKPLSCKIELRGGDPALFSSYLSSYRPKILYEYEVAGKKYSSNKVSFEMYLANGFIKNIERIVNRFKEGEIAVFYLPNHPRMAVLMPGVRLGGLLEFTLAVFLF